MIFYIWLLFAIGMIGGAGVRQGRYVPPPRPTRPIKKKSKNKIK